MFVCTALHQRRVVCATVAQYWIARRQVMTQRGGSRRRGRSSGKERWNRRASCGSRKSLGPATRERAGPANDKFKVSAKSGLRKRRPALSERLAGPAKRCAGQRRAALGSSDAPPAAPPTATRLDCVMHAAKWAQPLEMLPARWGTAEALAGGGGGGVREQDSGPRLRATREAGQSADAAAATTSEAERASSTRSKIIIINQKVSAKKAAHQRLPMQTSGCSISSRRRDIGDIFGCDKGTGQRQEQHKVRGTIRQPSVGRPEESGGLVKRTRTRSIRCPADYLAGSSFSSSPIASHSTGGWLEQQHSGSESGQRVGRRQLASASGGFHAQSMSAGPGFGGASSAHARPLGSEIQVIIDRLRAKTERAKDLVAASGVANRRPAGHSSRPTTRLQPAFRRHEMAQNEMELLRARSRRHQWQWSELEKSHECIVSKDRLSLCFHPHCSESTAVCRSKEPLRRNGNYYYWEIHVQDKTYGTSVMFGLCTKKQRLHANEYCNLVGLDENGWSVSHKGLAWHQGKSRQYTDMFPENRPVTIGLLYNSMRGELSYFMEGKNLGVAFSGLNQIDADLYPVVGSTAKCTQMRLVAAYCGNMTLLERASFTLLQSARDPAELLEYLRNFLLPKTLLDELTRVANVPQIDQSSTERETGGQTSGQDVKPEPRTNQLEDNDHLMNGANMST